MAIVQSTPVAIKYCRKCKQQKPTDEFYGKASQCKECAKAYMREHRVKYPGRRTEIARAWRAKNPESVRRSHRKRYQKERADPRLRSVRTKTTLRWQKRNRDKVLATMVRYHRKLKLMAFYAYAGVHPKCQCCGESEIEFLSIDHIHNDGAEHRRSLRSNGASSMYRWLRQNNYPAGFQVLCFNCNFAKGHHGSCPHTWQVADRTA